MGFPDESTGVRPGVTLTPSGSITTIVVEGNYIHVPKSTGGRIQLHDGVTSDVTIRHTLRF